MSKFGVFAATGIAAILFSTAAFASSDGKNRKITIVNNSDSAMHSIYAWPTNASGLQQDVLGSSTIAGHSSMTVDFDRGTTDCSFHLLAIMENYGFHDHDVNVCTASKWIIEDKSNSVE